MGTLIRTRHNQNNPGLAPAYTAQDYPQQPMAAPDQFDVRRLWTVPLSRKLLILLVTMAVVIPAALYSFLITPTYLSTVSIQIDPESVKVLPYNSLSDSLVEASPDFESYMKTQDVLLKSPALEERTVARLVEDYPGPDLPVIGSFGRGLRVERIAGSQIVNLNYASYEPKFSALAANTLAEEFIKLHFEKKVDTTTRATDFLSGQLETLKRKVEQAEEDLIDYAQKHDILDTDGNQQNVIRGRYGLISTQVSQVQTRYLAIKAEYEELQGITEDNFPNSMSNQEISNLEGSILAAEQDLSRLRTQFGENWPAVIRKNNDLEVLHTQLRKERQGAIEGQSRAVRLRLNTARTEYEMLNGKLVEQESLVNQLNDASVLYNSLERDLNANESLYQGLLRRLKETGVSPGLEFGNIHITDRARPSRRPYQPRPFWNLALALVLGLSAGGSLAFFLDYMDQSLKNPADLEKLGIPVLGWIPSMVLTNGKKTAIESKKEKKKGGAVLQLRPTAGPRQMPVRGINLKDMRACESYRSICASLLLSKAEEPARSILITSAIPREGKTTTTANLGVTLADAGVPTLLIDADFRNPSLSARFGLTSERGLSVHLAGGDINIIEAGIDNLHILPAGPLPPNPVALFTSAKFSETLTMLRQQFQFILIDSAPVLSVADSQILATKVDGVILVAKAGDTPQEIISRANIQLERAGACVLGAAVNHVNLKSPEYSYFRKYYFNEKYVQAPGTDKSIN